MQKQNFLDFVILGDVTNDFIVDLAGKSHHDVLGGSVLYTAGGILCWKNRVGVVGFTHQNIEQNLVKLLNRYQIDSSGLHYSNKPVDIRRFFGYISPEEYIDENPVAFYASKNILFPKSLIGYSKKDPEFLENEFYGKNALLKEDFPSNFLNASAFHFCPSSITKQIQFSSILHHDSKTCLTIQSDSSYMISSNWDLMPVLMKDLNAFITTRPQMMSLFRNRTEDIWEMTAYLTSLGCENLVIDNGPYGQLLYSSQTKKKYQLPAYPVEILDPTGMRESFCGGFLAGIKNNYDPLEALCFGNISASLTVEGIGPFYAADAYQGLIMNRLAVIKELVMVL